MRQKVEIRSWVTVAACGILFLSLGCGRQKDHGPSGMPPEKAAELRALQEKRENRQKQLHSMDVKQLVQELTSDSNKGREPFNSSAYREMVSRGEGVAVELKQSLTRADRSSLLGLLALRRVSSTQYHSLETSFRVNTLTSSLESSQYFNTWGIPNLYWEDAAKALIEEGSAAEPALLKLLRDKRPAPVFGSEGATVDAQFHYRVCDYAWALLNEIRHQKVELPADPAERDRLIEKTLKAGPTPKHK
jgi:hypothetical protein